MNRSIRLMNFLIILLLPIAALAADCESNYAGTGSLRHGKTYTSFADVAGVKPVVALQRIGMQLVGEGFVIQRLDEETRTLDAFATLSPGKVAPAKITAEEVGGGTRVRLSIDLPSGVFANAGTKAAVCRFIDFARHDPASRYQHPLMTYIRTNAENNDAVSVVESSTKKRIGKVLLGAAGGALLGALHAKVTGGDVGEGAVVGALAGGAVTFAISRMQDKRLATRDQVIAAESYDAAQGYRAGVRSITVEPALVKPGQKITIVTTYWALAPTAAEEFGVRRYAGIALSETFLRAFRFNPEPFRFAEGGGEYQTTIELDVPPQTPPGSYSLHWVIDGQSAGGESSAIFTVAG